MAVQDALEPTVTAQLVPPEQIAISYGALGTINGVTKFVSSSVVGIVWTAGSPVLSFGVAMAAMSAGTLVLLYAMRRQDGGGS